MKKFTAFCLALVITSAYSSTAFAADLYYPACSYDGESIVDALDSIGVESSYAHREAIAQAMVSAIITARLRKMSAC